tara:strand:+ start:30 stop:251 length:222 start_codon:yes stop_codon:yes gene_type:complete
MKVNKTLIADKFPDFCVDLKDKTILAIHDIGNGNISVKIKEKIKGAEPYNNEVHFYKEYEQKEINYIKKIFHK